MAGLFYGIGHTPNSGLVKGQVELDETGYVKVGGRQRAQLLGQGGGGAACRAGVERAWPCSWRVQGQGCCQWQEASVCLVRNFTAQGSQGLALVCRRHQVSELAAPAIAAGDASCALLHNMAAL